MNKAGLDVKAEWVAEGDFTFLSGVAAAEVILAQNSRPTAIFASNDDMAAGVVSVANRMGLVLPDDLSIGGFDELVFFRSILFTKKTTYITF